MDLDKIKNLVKQNGDKFIFVENGEPEVVMMSFREFENMLTNNPREGLRPQLYQEIRPTSSLEETEVIFQGSESADPGDIRLEDLPI